MNELRRKLWALITEFKTAVLITQGSEGFPHARTMECIKNSQHEEIWFATLQNERKTAEIAREPRVTVFYAHADRSWIAVQGIAELVSDQSLKSRYWKEEWKQYWPEGPLSEQYVLIRVVPVQADYLLQGQHERGRLAFKNSI